MTKHEAEKLCEYIESNCARYLVTSVDGLERGYSSREILNAIMEFAQKESSKSETCEDTCRPDYEKTNAELMAEVDYWKREHRSLREDNIRLEATLRTVEAWTGKNFLG